MVRRYKGGMILGVIDFTHFEGMDMAVSKEGL